TMSETYLLNMIRDTEVMLNGDRANHVISALSRLLGDANALARLISSFLGSQPVITTAADVNETIAVDLVGKEFGWTIENFENVTKTSAFMVNGEKIAIYQDAGEKNWWHGQLPKNVAIVDSLEKINSLEFKAGLVISDT